MACFNTPDFFTQSVGWRCLAISKHTVLEVLNWRTFDPVMLAELLALYAAHDYRISFEKRMVWGVCSIPHSIEQSLNENTLEMVFGKVRLEYRSLSPERQLTQRKIYENETMGIYRQVLEHNSGTWPELIRFTEQLSDEIEKSRHSTFGKLAATECRSAASWLARNETHSRIVMTTLAIERFRAQHGALPNGLDDLVPDYLESVPLDPFDGQPLRFNVDGNTYEVNSVFLVGQDNPGFSVEQLPVDDGLDAAVRRASKPPSQ